MAQHLIELALNYPVRSFSDRAIPEDETLMTPFPIERCIRDILVAIFQALVDDEAAGIDPRSSAQTIKQQTTPRLALVCKEWKEIVYNAPSLWNLIKIDGGAYLNRLSTTPLQSRHIEMAKDAPVDLFIFGFPAYFSDESGINSLLTIVPNIRKLHVELVTLPSQIISPPFLLSRAWPALQNLRELSYVAPPLSRLRSDLTAHLLGMPCLATLWLNDPGLTVPFRTAQRIPLLAKLKKLSITGSFIPKDSTAATMTPAFLSHCPEIEELDLTIMDPHNSVPIENAIFSDSQTLSLPRLRKLKSSGTVALAPFISSQIITPILADLALFNFIDRATSPVTQLFSQNVQTLTSLFLYVTDDAHFYRALIPLVHLTSLSLLAEGRGTFLTPLYEHLVLPSLRFFKLSMNRTSLSASHFSKFAMSRCIPVTVNLNTQRMTGAGYSALENFVLVALNPSMVLKHVRETPEWRNATVRKPRPCVFEMWWDLEVEGGTDVVDS